MALALQLYWSFRSPYSYIILPRVLELRHQTEIELDFRVVHPAAIRNPAYFARMDPLARPYFLMDSARCAAFHGLPFRRPIPDPIAQDPLTLAIAAEQPLARWLGRLGIAASDRGRGLEFAYEVAKLLWSGSVTGWNEGAHMSEAAQRAGLDLIRTREGRRRSGRATTRSDLPRTTTHFEQPVIGVSQQSSSTESLSSGRTASTSYFGAFSSCLPAKQAQDDGPSKPAGVGDDP